MTEAEGAGTRRAEPRTAGRRRLRGSWAQNLQRRLLVTSTRGRPPSAGRGRSAAFRHVWRRRASRCSTAAGCTERRALQPTRRGRRPPSRRACLLGLGRCLRGGLARWTEQACGGPVAAMRPGDPAPAQGPGVRAPARPDTEGAAELVRACAGERVGECANPGHSDFLCLLSRAPGPGPRHHSGL